MGDELVYTDGPATGAFPGNGTLTPTDINAHAINYNSIGHFSFNDVIFGDSGVRVRCVFPNRLRDRR